jgi:hypothetical protein
VLIDPAADVLTAARELRAVEPALPVIDVVVPVHDEEADLEPCLRRLHAYLFVGQRGLSGTDRATAARPTAGDCR